MQKGERLVFIAMLLLSLGFGGAATTGFYRQQKEERAALQRQLLAVAPSAIIGSRTDFLGNANSPYTLVEFGDYECPPCRAMHKQLPELLKRYDGQVRFTFRHLPLTSIHPNALPAAIAAEAARKQERFWPVHQALFTTELNTAAIQNVVRSERLDRARFHRDAAATAKKVVQDDIRQAEELGLQGTPSFILCCPDGRVIRLTSLDQLSTYVSL